MSAGVAGRKVYWWVASWAFASAMGSCIFVGVSSSDSSFFLSSVNVWICFSLDGCVLRTTVKCSRCSLRPNHTLSLSRGLGGSAFRRKPSLFSHDSLLRINHPEFDVAHLSFHRPHSQDRGGVCSSLRWRSP